MGVFVLVHGAWHGSWCWNKVVPLLEESGHRVEAPDLPGHGNDRTPLSEVNLEGYVQRVCGVLDALSEPAILVGHSMGGIVITQVAEYRPEKVKTLLYLTAILPRSGETLVSAVGEDKESILMPNVIMSEDKSYSTVRADAIKEIFYHDCSDEDVTLAMSLLVPQATLPQVTPVQTSDKNFGRVPRIYIECLKDKVISPSKQKEMYRTLPCNRVISMDTSHSPFFSAPEKLVVHLTSF